MSEPRRPSDSLPFTPRQSWTEPLMSVEYLRVALEVAAEKGIDTADLLRVSGLRPEQLDELDGRISHIAYGMLVFRLAELSGDHGVGFDIGLRLGPTAHGAVGHAVMCCETLQQVIDLFNRYSPTRVIGLQLHIKKQGRYVYVTVEREWEVVDAFTRIFLEGTLASLYRGLQILTGDPQPPVEVHLPYEEPACFAPFRERLPSFQFGKPDVRLRMPAELLQRRLVMPSPVGLRLALLRCEEELAALATQNQSWTARVQKLLRPGTHGYPTLPELAEKLSVSDRTLKRKLAAEGSQFKELLQETRRRDALTLLGNRALGIEQIATRLGYLNPANFTRAFVAWTGQLPSAYRKKNRIAPAGSGSA